MQKELKLNNLDLSTFHIVVFTVICIREFLIIRLIEDCEVPIVRIPFMSLMEQFS